MPASVPPAPLVRLPVPPGLLVLAGSLVALEAGGWSLRVLGAPPPVSTALSMDAPWSLPRLLVALVFTAAALAAWVGAGRLAGRRTWWTAIAVVTTLLALVKAGSTIHVRAVRAVGGDVHPLRGLLVFGSAAALGLAWLYWLSRHERRDRRRVLTWLGLYGAAAIGLSTGSLLVQSWVGWDSPLAATATFLEEGGEAVTSVGLLFAVLVGVAPRLVLPAGWDRRRPGADRTPVVGVGAAVTVGQ